MIFVGTLSVHGRDLKIFWPEHLVSLPYTRGTASSCGKDPDLLPQCGSGQRSWMVAGSMITFDHSWEGT